MGKRTWWPVDDEQLRRLYAELAGTGRLQEIGPIMGRTRTSVTKRAFRLGLASRANLGGATGDKNPRWKGGSAAAYARTLEKQAAERRARGAPQQHQWTSEEDAQLAALAPQMALREVAEAMGMTYGSVRRRVERLGLQRRSKSTWQKSGAGNHNWKGGPAASSRRVSYSMEPEDFDRLIRAQSGRCAICLRHEGEIPAKRKFHIDHDHDTGQIRGILCYNCNVLLGHAKDDVDVLRRAIEYLATFRRLPTAA